MDTVSNERKTKMINLKDQYISQQDLVNAIHLVAAMREDYKMILPNGRTIVFDDYLQTDSILLHDESWENCNLDGVLLFMDETTESQDKLMIELLLIRVQNFEEKLRVLAATR